MDGLSSTDAVEVLNASLAAELAAESDGDEEEGTLLGMSTTVQGMILLNISAALFGSNQVGHLCTADCTPGLMWLPDTMHAGCCRLSSWRDACSKISDQPALNLTCCHSAVRKHLPCDLLS